MLAKSQRGRAVVALIQQVIPYLVRKNALASIEYVGEYA